MENYIKTVLYAYPLLKSAEEAYRTCIQNKALLSYRSYKSAEEVAEAIVKEILEKEDLSWLKARIELALQGLTEEERALIAARFFGKKAQAKGRQTTERQEAERQETVRQKVGWKTKKQPYAAAESGAGTEESVSERQYFRRLNRAAEKAAAALVAAGITKDCYEEKFANVEILQRIEARLKKMQEKQALNALKKRADKPSNGVLDKPSKAQMDKPTGSKVYAMMDKLAGSQKNERYAAWQ